MSFTRILLFLLILCVSIQGSAQQSATPVKPVRDPQALAAVQAAISAMGGAAAIGQPQSWQIQGQVQATDPKGTSVSGTIAWEMAGSEFSMAATTNLSTQSIVTGHGNPASVSASGTVKIPANVMRAHFVPALIGPMLLKEYQNQNYNIMFAGNKTLGTEPVIVVRTSVGLKGMNPRVTRQIWYFDKTSGLPVRVEYSIPAMGSQYAFAMGAVDLSDFQHISGAMYPFQIASSFMNRPTGTITLQSVNLNVSIASTDFDPPVSAQ